MRTILTTTFTLAALGLGALLTIVPAIAKQNGGVPFMSARQLQQFCKAQNGHYAGALPNYFCVLGSSAINCDARAHQCTAVAIKYNSSDNSASLPDYPPDSLVGGILVPDRPVHKAPEPVGGPVERGHGPRIPH